MSQLTMQTLEPLVPTEARVLPDWTLMLSPERFTFRESRRSCPSSSVLKLYPSLNAAYCTAATNSASLDQCMNMLVSMGQTVILSCMQGILKKLCNYLLYAQMAFKECCAVI